MTTPRVVELMGTGQSGRQHKRVLELPLGSFALKESRTCSRWGTLMSARLSLDDCHASKVWLQNTRYQDAAVLKLVVFH